ncbi:hypothetical protein KY318_01985, partial [Candidatus Woesearchaeota archaeon]|nr:hypothetical protein [Candidatus Woesearchaeota archaeon]
VHIMTTNCLGVYVFDERFKLVHSKRFSRKELQDYKEQLESGEWLNSELEAINKLKGRIIFLGFKKKRPGVVVSQDIEKLTKVSSMLLKEVGAIKEANTLLSSLEFEQGFTEDLVVIHLLRTIEDLERVINGLIMRIKDFVKLYFPEQVGKLDDNLALLELVAKPGKDEIGYHVGREHREAFKKLAMEVMRLIQQRDELSKHLEKTMQRVCPNVLAVGGAMIGAKLLSLAGSLKKLAQMPYSKLQVLGAEKAMFRHVIKGSKTPKHGILINHPLVASAKSKGKAARLVAEKLTIAARLDYFKGGDRSKQLLEDLKKRLK